MEKEVLASYKKAGEIVSEALSYGKTLVVPDANILDVCQKVEKKIISLGGKPAFPAQPSINNIAAHWCPDPDSTDLFEEGQLVKLDIGVHVGGYVADTALSLDLSDDKRHEELIRSAKNALHQALKLMKPGMELGKIGQVIQDNITEDGFSPIRNLSGHGLAQFEVHTTPTIPNFNTHDKTILEEDMVVAVEPFATTGVGQVYEQDIGNIYSLVQRRPVRNTYARKALKIIEGYNGLPFCSHWLANEMGIGPAKFAMRELIQNESVEVHPPLPEKSGSVVSQAEHSVIVRDSPIVFTKSTF